MTRDFIRPRASFQDSPSHRNFSSDDSYRTRTPSHTNKIGLRSASPSPYVKSNGYSFKGASYSSQTDSMTKQDTDGTQGYGYKKPTRRGGGGKGRKPLMERSGNAADAGITFEYNANHREHANQSSVTDPGFRAYSGIPIKGAAATDFAKTTQPKHFTQPLTCFYWHNNGFCTKSDEGCLYAHYYTGVVASAPVSVGGVNGVVAGRNAIEEVNQHALRESELMEWEARLAAKEMKLNGRSVQVCAPTNIEAILESIEKTILTATTAADGARRVLKRRREEVKSLLPKLLAIGDVDTNGAILAAIDGAIGAVSGLELDLARIEEEAEEKIGRSLGLLDEF
ncbi:hypothetical protein LTR36_001768 [Oleoguttula mirabilis]|uniref:C3H1-type domain-containing protein n=1 Tax=Oleoguttula mirabilis TaxID=1507867 RepID=A0AAV9JMK3_9PEZI|nr:hypothetical protein LTR36_001768 [Oleoguttula mirabilis]